MWAGSAVLGILAVNLYLALTFYPVRYVNGVACSCGRPGWVTYWTVSFYALVPLFGALLFYGIWVDRKLHPPPKSH